MVPDPPTVSPSLRSRALARKRRSPPCAAFSLCPLPWDAPARSVYTLTREAEAANEEGPRPNASHKNHESVPGVAPPSSDRHSRRGCAASAGIAASISGSSGRMRPRRRRPAATAAAATTGAPRARRARPRAPTPPAPTPAACSPANRGPAPAASRPRRRRARARGAADAESGERLGGFSA